MKWLFLVLLVSGCSSLKDPDAPYGSEISPNRLNWPNKVEKLQSHSGTIYIIKGRSK